VALQPGAQIGSYEVTALIGAGGMGEVYRATDTNLGRQVAIKVCAAAPPLGASWSADNTILSGQSEGIMRVSADGGTPEVVVKSRRERGTLRTAADARRQIGALHGHDRQRTRSVDQAKIVVQSLSTGARTVVVTGGSVARYLATGHLVYVLRDELLAVAFDARRLAVTGGPRSLVRGVLRPIGVSAMGANYAVSSQGTLVYASAALRRSPVWFEELRRLVPVN
jgi:hypothetical protein